MITIGSLFSGIGGLELGLERAGLGPVVWQVEIDPYCREVLAKHWPDAERFDDVRAIGVSVCPPPVSLICGGFPCQGMSAAGKRRGFDDERSGLWREFRRIVEQLVPRFVVVENVASGRKLWLPTVRLDLEAIGYRTRAIAISAADVGAPHLRRRIFVVADRERDDVRDEQQRLSARRPLQVCDERQSEPCDASATLADGNRERGDLCNAARSEIGDAARNSGDVADSDRTTRRRLDEGPSLSGIGSAPHCGRPEESRRRNFGTWPPLPDDLHAWRSVPSDAQPAICRMAHGLSVWLDGTRKLSAKPATAGARHRLKALGNAVVPACAEVVGRIVAEELAS